MTFKHAITAGIVAGVAGAITASLTADKEPEVVEVMEDSGARVTHPKDLPSSGLRSGYALPPSAA